MIRIFRFNVRYFIIAVLIFIIEVLIALYLDDSFIRPYFGDFLVVILVYCFLKSFLNITVLQAALASLIFAYFVEALQYMDIITKLGLQDSRLAKTVLGSSFEWSDILAYTLGIIFVIIVERRRPL